MFTLVGIPLLGRAAVPPTPKIVIDPGHGGSDEGTVFDGGTFRLAEKDVTLRLAQVVKAYLKQRGYHVTLTRDTDKELNLPARTALANRIQADLFISIHLNSIQDPRRKSGLKSSKKWSLLANFRNAHGVETYILNHTSDASSKRLARLENSVISTHPTHNPKEKDIALILKDLRLDANLSRSQKLACQIQEDLAAAPPMQDHPKMKNRGVKQALFHVLLGADMPSVLVEAGFLSHPEDRARVLSPQGRLQMGAAIATAIQNYFSPKTSKSLQLLNNCKIR
jgi:N-acetylmuramoyl-L-alanine amidase